MALEEGNGDHQSRATLGRRALRPVASDVRIGVDRGDGVVGTYDPAVSGTYPEEAEVLDGVVYGAADELTGTLNLAPSTTTDESLHDKSFKWGAWQPLFQNGAIDITYWSAAIGANKYIKAVIIERGEKVLYDQFGQSIENGMKIAVKMHSTDGISEVRAEEDYWVVESKTYRVLVQDAIMGNIVVLVGEQQDVKEGHQGGMVAAK